MLVTDAGPLLKVVSACRSASSAWRGVRERVGYDDRGRRHQPVDAVCEVGGGNGPEGGVACQNTGETPSHGRVLDAQIENEAVQQTVHLARPRHSLVWSEIVWK